MVARGDVHWCDFGDPTGSAPAYRSPAVVVQGDKLNRSATNTTMVAPLTSNTRRASVPGNVFLSSVWTGLPEDAVFLADQVTAVDVSQLESRPVASLPSSLVTEIDKGLRLALDL